MSTALDWGAFALSPLLPQHPDSVSPSLWELMGGLSEWNGDPCPAIFKPEGTLGIVEPRLPFKNRNVCHSLPSSHCQERLRG